ncbi:MAG TPA: 2'-5' RNA ligase family protein [Ktedonobacterales bacterium]
MYGVVSLLDDAHWQAVADIWDELEQARGIKRLREIIPYPHVTYHGAEEYDFDRLDGALTRLAATSTPFVIQTAGVGIFTGTKPVLYLAVVRNPELTRYHQAVWAALAEAHVSVHAVDLYHPDRWVPHITLAQHDVDATTLPEAVRLLGERALAWDLTISNIAVLHPESGRAEVWRRYTLEG